MNVTWLVYFNELTVNNVIAPSSLTRAISCPFRKPFLPESHRSWVTTFSTPNFWIGGEQCPLSQSGSSPTTYSPTTTSLYTLKLGVYISSYQRSIHAK